MKKKLFAFICLLFFISSNIFSASSTDSHTPEPYGEKEFPSWLKDLRRAEIITLGAMPFITFNVSLGFWAINGFDESHSPFDGTSESDVTKYTNSQTVGILLTSLGISAGIGLSDFLVHLLKTQDISNKNKKKMGNINIESVKDDPDAVKIPLPIEEELESEEMDEILQGEE
ncbi:MAG: hypothetical protein K6E78_08675 [Treponema sp.]|nr:hypothetical protein [Treponema sp.]